MAVEKDILEFEVRLLSEVVREWKDHIKQLLIEVNTIMDTRCIFSLFIVDSEGYDLEIFWRATPTEQSRKILEKRERPGTSEKDTVP